MSASCATVSRQANVSRKAKKATIVAAVAVAGAVAVLEAGPVPATRVASIVSVSVTTLATLGGSASWANDINNAGVVVGTSQVADGTWHAFRASGGRMSDISGGRATDAQSINDLGVIVGGLHEDGRWRPAWWDLLGRFALLPELSPRTSSACGPIAVNASANSISTTGHVTGIVTYNPTNLACPYIWDGVVWDTPATAPTLVTLPLAGTAEMAEVNDRGQVAMTAVESGESRANRWEAGVRTFLHPGHVPGEFVSNVRARGINADGWVIGSATYATPTSSTERAVLWLTGARQRLGLLTGGSSSVGADVNDEGFVVGTATRPVGGSQVKRGFIWQRDIGMVELPIPTTLTGLPCEATAVNNVNGASMISVVGYCRTGVGDRATRWDIGVRIVPRT